MISRVRVRPMFSAFLRFGMAIACAAFLGCSTSPSILVPQSVVGRWRGAESKCLLEFTDSGIFVVELAEGTTLIGRCSFVGDRVTMRYQLGAAICPEEPGQYTLAIDGANMRTTEPVDTCADRIIMMHQAWALEAK
ncbi:MAG: hypothetical protein EXS15_06845 [Phycisphaerales bacterium]|nr:hypothetical protein [Phycisphaerales bacterium]